MQRGVGHGGSGQTNRANHRLGGQNTGAPHLNHNILHHGVLDFRRVFVGHGPTGKFGRAAHPFPLRQAVHLDYRAVNVAGELIPVLVDGEHLLIDFANLTQRSVGNDLETQAFQKIQRFGVGPEFHALSQLDIKNQNIQSPSGRDFRIKLAKGTGSRVSGIGKQGLPLLFLPGVQLFKALFGHIYLAPDDQPGWSIFQRHWDGADGFQILCHILPHRAVAPGGTPNKTAVNIFQRHGQAVNLRLHGKRGIRVSLQRLFQKFIQFFHGKHIL